MLPFVRPLKARFLPTLVLLLFLLSSCDFNAEFGCHDFFWNLNYHDRIDAHYDMNSMKYFGGVIQTRNDKPVYAICVISNSSSPLEYDTNGNGRMTALNGHRFQAPLGKKAVYALQNDYSLRKLELSDREVDFALGIFNRIGVIEVPIEQLLAAPLFNDKIRPQLRFLQLPLDRPGERFRVIKMNPGESKVFP
jgi:hypothetical protein